MATLTTVKPAKREAALAKATKDGAKSLAGGLNLPEGTHKFVVADEANAFGILNVESQASGKWALPIVAGVVHVKGGSKEVFELSDKPGAKTLVIADNFYLNMQPNTAYNITIESRKGRKVVTNVVPADGAESEDDGDDD